MTIVFACLNFSKVLVAFLIKLGMFMLYSDTHPAESNETILDLSIRFDFCILLDNYGSDPLSS